MASSFFLCKVCGKEIPEHDVKFSSDGKTVLTPDGVPEDIFCSNCELAHITENTVKKSNKKTSSKKGRLDYGKMKMVELKEILKSKKLPLSGPKWQLIDRLTLSNWRELEQEWAMKKGKDKIKKTQLIYGKFLIIGLIAIFIFSFLLTLLVASPFEGGYFYEDYDKGTTTNNIFEIDFRMYVESSVGLSVIIIVFIVLVGAMQNENAAKILIGLFLLFGSMAIVEVEGIGFGWMIFYLLAIIVVLYAINENESMIEAAGHAWLMLTILGAIFAIIFYVILF